MARKGPDIQVIVTNTNEMSGSGNSSSTSSADARASARQTQSQQQRQTGGCGGRDAFSSVPRFEKIGDRWVQNGVFVPWEKSATLDAMWG